MKLLEARAWRILGRVAVARARLEEAEVNLRQSLAMAQRLGAHYEVGLALLGLAELYTTRLGQPGYRRRRSLALTQAAATFRRLGAEPELSRVTHMLDGQRSEEADVGGPTPEARLPPAPAQK
jgi:hypothetical protein